MFSRKNRKNAIFFSSTSVYNPLRLGKPGSIDHLIYYFQKKIFITGVTIAIVPKHNFPDISHGEHDKEETAYLKYTKQKKTVVCTFTLWVNEGFCRMNFFTKMVIVSKKVDFWTSELSVFAARKKSFCLKLKILCSLRAWRYKLQFLFVLCISDKQFLLYHAHRERCRENCVLAQWL